MLFFSPYKAILVLNSASCEGKYSAAINNTNNKASMISPQAQISLEKRKKSVNGFDPTITSSHITDNTQQAPIFIIKQ